MKDHERTGVHEVRRRLSRAVEAASGGRQVGLRRVVPSVRRQAPEVRLRTDLVWRFREVDIERLKTPSFRGVSPKGMDVIITCRSCGWESRPFPFDAIVFRSTATPHFAYIKAERIYACRAGVAVPSGQGLSEDHHPA